MHENAKRVSRYVEKKIGSQGNRPYQTRKWRQVALNRLRLCGAVPLPWVSCEEGLYPVSLVSAGGSAEGRKAARATSDRGWLPFSAYAVR